MDGPLDKSWRDQIWLPHLTFSNTKGNSPLSVDESGDDSIVVEGAKYLFFFSPLVPSKQEKNILVLLSLYIFGGKCDYFSIFE